MLTRLNCQDYLENYRSILTKKQLDALFNDWILKDFDYIDIPNDELIDLENKRKSYDAKCKYWAMACDAEKARDYSTALVYWERVLTEVERFPTLYRFPHYAHAIDRMAIHYRRFKNYRMELYMCEYALNHELDERRREQIRKRIAKALLLQKRSETK